MHSLTDAGFLMFQSDASAYDAHRTMIFTGVIAICLVAQATALVVVAVFAARLIENVTKSIKRIEDRVLPVVDKASSLVTDLAPKIHVIGTNVEGISYTVRAKVDEIGEAVSQLNATVQDVNFRSRVQVARVDGIVTHVVATTAEISESVSEGIKVPIRQIAGVLAGVRAGLETLLARSPFSNWPPRR